VQRLDRLAHVDRVVAGAGPGRVEVVALPEGGRREHDIGVPGGRRQEVVLRDDELDLVKRGRDLARVRALVEQIAARRVDELDVGRIAAGASAREQVGQQWARDARAGRVAAGRQSADPGIAGGAVADAAVAAGDPDVAGDRGKREGGAVELLAVD